jgi:PTH1 family peptidyl-tRNA hydrolase
MKIIIGLGNPEEKYNDTRHNVGFAVLDKIQAEFNFPEFSFNKKFNAEISSGTIEIAEAKPPRGGLASKHSAEILLVKPQTFMNLSGESVRAILDFYKLAPEDIIVIQDDIDIEIGTFKLATDSRSAGHNGVQNIIDQLGTQKFVRLRIGIGATTTDEPSCRLGAHDFVLGKFSKEEEKKINSLFAEILGAIKKLL